MITLQEHERIIDINEPNDRFKHLKLVSWGKPMDDAPAGYYATFKIGAEWIDQNEALVVTTKRQMENIDFLSMFTSCFTADLDHQSFAQIYSIQYDQPPINAPALRSVISPLIVLHFLGVLSRIKTLKKGYVYYSENLKKVKGHIAIIKNERTNIAVKRYCLCLLPPPPQLTRWLTAWRAISARTPPRFPEVLPWKACSC